MNNMHTYLPPERKKEIRKEYIIRLIITFCATLLAVIICGIIFMLPAYFSSYSERAQALAKLENFKDTGVTTEIKEIEAEVKSITDITNRFSEGIDRTSAIDIIKIGQAARVPGVVVNGFEFTYTASSTVELRLFGQAKTRDALILFKKNVEANPAVTRVDLPVSDLAKSKDLTFAMRIFSK
jgi:hypothetical protein